MQEPVYYRTLGDWERVFSYLIKKPKNGLLPTFSPDLTWNRQIWLFYPEKWIFFKKFGTLLNNIYIQILWIFILSVKNGLNGMAM